MLRDVCADPAQYLSPTPPASSGKQFEERVGRALSAQGLVCYGRDVPVGKGPLGTEHLIDWLVAAPGEDFWQVAVSCKWQGRRGTTEQKLDHEVTRLLCLLRDNPRIARAHLVIDGPGFSPGMREHLSVGLAEWMPRATDVDMHFGLDAFSRRPLATEPLAGRCLPAPTLF